VIFNFNVGVMDSDVLAYGKLLIEDASLSDFFFGGGGGKGTSLHSEHCNFLFIYRCEFKLMLLVQKVILLCSVYVTCFR
jgi:hypothetical protein